MKTTLNNTAFKFIIPVYENMPDEVCAEPTGDGNPNNRLKSLSVEGYTFTPTFSLYTTEYDLIVENNVSKVTVKADITRYLSSSSLISLLLNYSCCKMIRTHS